jgi:hypothetical protein
MITAARVRELLDYDPDTGVMRWRVPRGRAPAGAIAGFNEKGYRGIRVDSVQTYIHRLVFLHVHGYEPKIVDHLNGDRSDNRLANLRDVTQSINLRNRRVSSANKSGITGVFWCTDKGRWAARIKVNRRTTHLGYFTDIQDAAAARKRAERELGFTARHGVRPGTTIPPDKFAFDPERGTVAKNAARAA